MYMQAVLSMLLLRQRRIREKEQSANSMLIESSAKAQEKSENNYRVLPRIQKQSGKGVWCDNCKQSTCRNRNLGRFSVRKKLLYILG